MGQKAEQANPPVAMSGEVFDPYMGQGAGAPNIQVPQGRPNMGPRGQGQMQMFGGQNRQQMLANALRNRQMLPPQLQQMLQRRGMM